MKKKLRWKELYPATLLIALLVSWGWVRAGDPPAPGEIKPAQKREKICAQWPWDKTQRCQEPDNPRREWSFDSHTKSH